MDETGNMEHSASDATLTTSDGPSTPRLSPSKSSIHGEQQEQHEQHEQQEFANPTLNIMRSITRRKSTSALSIISREDTPPPLPPRPKNLALLDARPSTSYSAHSSNSAAPGRPQLVSKATTQLSYTNTQLRNIEARDESFSSGASRARPFFGLNPSQAASDLDDSMSSRSARSLAPTIEVGGDAESVIEDGMGQEEKSVLRALGHKFSEQELESMFPADADFEQSFAGEFDEIEDMAADGSNEEKIMIQWRSKLKHFLILSSAGKPIYSRHGDDQVVSNYIGVIQTIISFHQSRDDSLKSFSAGGVRFVVSSKGPLNLVAISRLPESDAQLRAQLDALYTQILSTLTLPTLKRMFAARANYDLRRPLQGTETLLSALSDGFTRGSPSTLLSALECLKLRKSQRATINKTLLATRSPNLLYGLIVASGRLVSVVRPKKHSLHPGDLHLIFNMLFEAGSVKAGGGENWIPVCLPGFNNTGFLYMYVSFLDLERPGTVVDERPTSQGIAVEGEVAVLLISADKEGFFELRGMRDKLVEQLQQNGSIEAIRSAVRLGRPRCTDMVPGTPLRHFLYKSRGNVQFVMPRFEAYFARACDRRRLLLLYAHLQASLHAKPTALKVHHETSATNIALAWSTPLFELYAVAPASTSRGAMASAANKVVQWVRKEEERCFIIGGAVF